MIIPYPPLVEDQYAWIADIAALFSAIAWPLFFAGLLFWLRKPVHKLITATVSIAETADKVKIWQIEFDRNVRQELHATEMHALRSEPMPEIPIQELSAARRVNDLIAHAPSPSVKDNLLASIRERMLAFAHEYDATRAQMRSGTERTRALNAIAAKMRTLALAATPFLDEFSRDTQFPGRRLAAICILQLAPDIGYLQWLVERMSVEQPFVFFNASVALLALVRNYGRARRQELKAAIESALHTVNSYTKGQPDVNTVRTLVLAISELNAEA